MEFLQIWSYHAITNTLGGILLYICLQWLSRSPRTYHTKTVLLDQFWHSIWCTPKPTCKYNKMACGHCMPTRAVQKEKLLMMEGSRSHGKLNHILNRNNKHSQWCSSTISLNYINHLTSYDTTCTGCNSYNTLGIVIYWKECIEEPPNKFKPFVVLVTLQVVKVI